MVSLMPLRSKREAICRHLRRTAPLSPLGDGARKRPEWANPSLLAQSAGSDCRSLGPPSCPVLLLLLGRTTEEANSACEGIGDFLRVGHLHRPAKSPTGIQGKRTDALCRAAQWLKSSLKLSEKSRRCPNGGFTRGRNGTVGPVWTPEHRPNPRSESYSEPFQTVS
jgi:hypothetical protein